MLLPNGVQVFVVPTEQVLELAPSHVLVPPPVPPQVLIMVPPPSQALESVPLHMLEAPLTSQALLPVLLVHWFEVVALHVFPDPSKQLLVDPLAQVFESVPLHVLVPPP